MEVTTYKTVNRPAPAQVAAAHKVVGSHYGNLHQSGQKEKAVPTDETLKSPYLARFEESGIFDKHQRKKENLESGHSTTSSPVNNRSQQKPKVAVTNKRTEKKSGKIRPEADSMAGKIVKALSNSKVAKYLHAKGSPILQKGLGAIRKLKENEQKHDDVAEKLTQSEKSVVNPTVEGQSRSNAGQVDQVSNLTAPVADESKGKKQLQQSLAQNIPQTIEDVDNFKQDRKAQGISAAVMSVVLGDKNAVVSTFSEIGKTPAPAPPEQTPETLPAEEIAPVTPEMNLGRDAIAPLHKEHTDVSNYVSEAEGKLKEEGVTQEQLDMVDSGDLAEANREKKGLEKTSKTEQAAVQDFASQETGKVESELKQEEKKGRDELKNKRKSDLGNTSQKQKGAKSALEKKREEVANKINTIFKNAQNKVVNKLNDLESQSMKRFDLGNSRAAVEFENNVNSELGAFQAVRYKGIRGKLRKAKDWLLGMEDLPEVKAIFDRNRNAFVNTINQLVETITADNKKVISECKDLLVNAKKQISEFVAKLGPELRDIGQKVAGEMNTKLTELDHFVNKKEQELQQKLEDKQKLAIKAIDDKIEKMKEAMAGALSKIGKLLLMAAKKFFTWALQKFGYSLSEIEGLINKGVSVLKSIFTKPIQFVKNLVHAATTGFKNFGKNFLTHLKDAIFNWLTGSLGGIQLPETWDIKGVASVALQVIGISYENIRTHLVKYIPETVIASLEKSFDLVKTLITEGPMAAWDQLKEMGSEMRDAFVDAAKEWVRNTIVVKAIETIGSMLIPGAGIIRAIVGIYDTVMFFVQKAKDIARMVGNFLGSIGEIAVGNIGAAASALENGLATALSLVIDFLARFLRLSGISEKIKKQFRKYARR